jgi:hypothetical protein
MASYLAEMKALMAARQEYEEYKEDKECPALCGLATYS